MKAKPRSKTVDVALVVVGQLAVLSAYFFFFKVIATGSGPATPLPLILLSALALVTGISFNHVAPEGSVWVRIAAWMVHLAPLLAVWIYASIRPPFGDARAASTAVDILLFLIFVASVFGALGFLRAEERDTRAAATGGLWAFTGLVAIVTLFIGHAGAGVLATMVAALAAQLLTLDALRREAGWTFRAAAAAE